MPVETKASYEKLPGHVVPKHYNLTIEPDFTKFTFDGVVIIDGDVVQETCSISVNTLELEVHSAKIHVVQDGNKSQATMTPKIQTSAADQVTEFLLESPLAKGSKVKLEISFTGCLNDKMAGFYRSTFEGKDGKESIMGTTQMAPTDARRAFPCFDEPALKAEFTVTLVADQHLTCLSNMDIASDKIVQSKITGTERKSVTFNKTPVMSTYLVAFVIGELNYIESLEFRVPCRIYAPVDQNIQHGRFALDLTVKTLDFFETCFGSKFPLPKMDQIAIPDFAAGAMENWGLITYRTIALLIDEKHCEASLKQVVADVVQHELSHQWFGNLVTMDWWEGLWLNEGFATWAASYATDHFFPEWHVWQNYAVNHHQPSLNADSFRSSHPVQAPILRVSDIHQIFDGISYSKGSSVIRMLSAYLGEDVFLEGIRVYLAKHAYGNANTGDLWKSLAETSGKPVYDIMATWTEKVGYPVIAVSEETDSEGAAIRARQSRFLRTGDVREEEDQTIYPIFLNIQTEEGVDKGPVLNVREKTFRLKDLDFFKINAGQSGFYRVLYTPDRLGKLGEAAKEGKISVDDRIGLLADAGSLSYAGNLKTSGLLNLVKSFTAETDFNVWGEIFRRFDSLKAAWNFEDANVRKGIEAFLRNLTSPVAHKVGWTFAHSDAHVERQFKAMMFEHAGLNGDPDILDAAKAMFEKSMTESASSIPPDIEGAVYKMALKIGTAREYDMVLECARTSDSEARKRKCQAALGYAEQPELMERTLQLLQGDTIRAQDALNPLPGLTGSPEGARALFDYFKTHFDELQQKFPPQQPLFSGLASVMLLGLSKEAHLAEVNHFFEGKDTAGYNQILGTVRDAIQSRYSWADRDREDVAAWLKANGYMV